MRGLVVTVALAVLPLTTVVAAADTTEDADGSWITLGRGISAEQRRQRVPVEETKGQLRALRIACDRGAPKIERVLVEYSDHQTEQLTVDARLAPDQPRTFALDGRRRVLVITVVSDPEQPGAYSLFGA
ncbi:MAG: hypothetical protein IPQ07_24435 [Myxococcales bacterium]|nr:hypothetical protein [Myxococcales bacterium]